MVIDLLVLQGDLVVDSLHVSAFKWQLFSNALDDKVYIEFFNQESQEFLHVSLDEAGELEMFFVLEYAILKISSNLLLEIMELSKRELTEI